MCVEVDQLLHSIITSDAHYKEKAQLLYSNLYKICKLIYAEFMKPIILDHVFDHFLDVDDILKCSEVDLVFVR